MHLLLYGDNLVKSRQELISVEIGYRDVIHLEGNKINLTAVLEACESTSLFSTKKLVVIENLFKLKSKNQLQEIIAYLTQTDLSLQDIVIWSAGKLTPSNLKPFNQWMVKAYNASPFIFQFLDDLTLSGFNRACQQDTFEFVLNMLYRHVVQLYAVLYETSSAPVWQQSKLQSQLRQLGKTKLDNLFSKLVDFDWRQKTGQSVGDSQTEIAFILANL